MSLAPAAARAPELEVLADLEAIAWRAERSPLDWMDWLPPQWALLHATDRRVLLRSGNQFGKTWAGLSETVFRCLGRHPFKKVRPPPIEAWVVTASWSQSIAVQTKLWELLPKDEIDPSTEFDPKRGFRGGLTPTILFRNGSILRIKTTGQGGLKISAATIHFVLIDEPLSSARLYGELDRRLMRTRGDLYMTITPVNADCTWIAKLVEEEKIVDLHFRLEAENFRWCGRRSYALLEDGTPMDEEWVESERASVFSWEAPVVLDGEWEFTATDRLFEAYHPATHRIPRILASDVCPTNPVDLVFGIDYGEDRLRTCAVVAAVDRTDRHAHRVYVLGEYVPTGPSDIDADARGILSMLAALGIKWSDLDYAFGDKRYTDARGFHTIKSNDKLLEALERAMKTKRGLRPKIYGAKRGPGRGRGAPHFGYRYLNDAMIREGCFYVDAACTWGDECLAKFDGSERSPHKDWTDALRYALTHHVFERRPVSRRLIRMGA